MKYIFGLIVLAVAGLFAVPAQAQSYNLRSAVILSNSVATTLIASEATNSTVRSTIPATKGDNLSLQCTVTLAGAGTSAVVFKFDESVDGVSWESSAHTVSVTAAGTTPVTTVANVAVGSIGYLRLSSIENPNAQVLTVAIKYAQKTP